MWSVISNFGSGPLQILHHSTFLCCVQVLIKFKNFFYFEEKDEPVEDFDKVYKFF